MLSASASTLEMPSASTCVVIMKAVRSRWADLQTLGWASSVAAVSTAMNVARHDDPRTVRDTSGQAALCLRHVHHAGGWYSTEAKAGTLSVAQRMRWRELRAWALSRLLRGFAMAAPYGRLTLTQ